MIAAVWHCGLFSRKGSVLACLEDFGDLLHR